MLVRSLDGEDALEEEIATHSSIPAWRIQWTGAWQATVHGVTKSWTQQSTHTLWFGILGEGTENTQAQ